MPFYAVAKGRSPAVYQDWNECKDNVHGFSGARYKKFNTMAEAQSFITENGSSSNMSTSPSIGYSPSVSKPRAVRSTTREARTPTVSGTPTQSSSTVGESRVYVDGACRGNGRKVSGAGIGVYFEDFPAKSVSRAFSEFDTSQPTNQKAELYAMKYAIKSILNESKSERGLNQRYKVYTDSNYVKNSITTWKDKWKTNGWKNSKGEPVANAEIIKEIDADLEAVNKVYRKKNWNELEFVHVKGHSGDPGNEVADELANQGAAKDAIYRHYR